MASLDNITIKPSSPDTQSEMQRLLDKSHSPNMASLIDRTNDPMAAIDQLGTWLARSLVFGCQSKEQGIIIVLACRELGIGLTEFARTYEIVMNKLRKKALAAHAEFLKLGGKVRWLDLGSKDKPAAADLTFDGQTLKIEFSIDDARAAGLVKKDSNWEKWTSDMLCARVLSRGIARLAPQVYAGCEDDSSSAVSEMTGLPPLQLSVEETRTVNETAKQIISEAKAEAERIVKLPTPDVRSPDEKAEAAAGLAPVEKPKAKTPEVDEESFGKFLTLIDGKEQDCIRFLRQFPEGQTPWIGADDALMMISKGNLAWILKKPDAFKKRLNDFIAKEAK